MPSKATFYHAGCPVCVSAEETVARGLDPVKYALEVVHLGEDAKRIVEAAAIGVQSVPALVVDDTVYHINFGAKLSDLQ